MRRAKKHGLLAVLPLVVSTALVLSACGGGGNDAANTAQQNPGAATDTNSAPAADTSGAAAPGTDTGAAAPVAGGATDQAPVTGAAGAAPVAGSATNAKGGAAKVGSKGGAGVAKATAADTKGLTAIDSAAQAVENQRIAEQKGGATDQGVTADSIKMGTVTMHGIALGNLLATPLVNGIKATMASVNDRGGVLGRRMSLIDCDDGPGEVSRSK
ncbi:MAG TPA: ABC transporter substrate-binding protein, partial [Sporichthya sp.]|nr:ABC transporter substrate-binding protein [Sporichthya sp.]